MVDLETFGKQPNGAIASIGAVSFDIEGTGFNKEFYHNISLKDSIANGFEIDPDTLYWWFKQDAEAGKKLSSNLYGVRPVLEAFRGWVYGIDYSKMKNGELYLWSHATFDTNILMSAFKRMGISWPFHYRNGLDLRTAYFFAGGRPELPDDINDMFLAHDALADAKKQVIEIQECYRIIKGSYM